MHQNDEGRRSFLKRILAGSAVATTVALKANSAKAAKQNTAQRPEEILYRETEAFKSYYKSLR